MSELKEELARCCGTVADKEAMAAEIAELEQRVTDINRIAVQYRDERDALAEQVAVLQEQLAADKPNLELVVGQLSDDAHAAKVHARHLATELEYSRHSWRLAQYQLTQVKAVLGGVACTLHTVNLGELASQLRGVAAGLESIDNGADAALVRRAGNLLDLFNTAIIDGKRL